MNLHARNLAIASGVPKELIEECVNFMKNRGVYRKETAEEFMKAYNIFRSVREATPPITQKRVLSTFSSNFKFAGLNEALSLHIVFDCCSKEPIHVTFDSDMKGQNKKLMHQIFGEKSYDWFQKLFAVIQKIRLDYELQGAQIPSKTLTYKLKIIAILVDLICFNMVSLNYDQSKCIYEELIEEYNSESIRNVNEIIVIEDIGIKYGLHLMVELARIFKYNLDQQRLNENLKGLLKGELL